MRRSISITVCTFVVSILVGSGSFAARTGVVATLPSAETSGTSSIWDGSKMYIFGGVFPYDNWNQSWYTDAIYRFDPATGSVTKMGAVLPSPRGGTSAVWDGRYAYIFGGRGASGDVDEIVRFDPVNDTISVMGSRLTGKFMTSAAWDGRYAYVIGGSSNQSQIFSYGNYGETASLQYHSGVYRFDPVADTLTLAGWLPTPRSATSAIWDGVRLSIFGGWDGRMIQETVRFDTVTGSTQTFPEYVSKPASSAIWTGSGAFTFGGIYVDERNTFFEDGVFRHHWGTWWEYFHKNLPAHGTLSSAVWTGQGALVVLSDGSIVEYDLVPTAPWVVGSSGPQVGQTTISFGPPPEDSNHEGPVIGYKIYRGDTFGSQSLLATVGNVSSYTDSGIPNGKTYYYSVTVLVPSGEGDRSYPIAVSAPSEPAPPTELQARPALGGGVDLAWKPPANDGGLPVNGYKVYRRGSGPTPVIIATTVQPRYIDTGCPSLTQCTYSVAAVNPVGIGQRSAEATSLSSPAVGLLRPSGYDRGSMCYVTVGGNRGCMDSDQGAVAASGARYGVLQVGGAYRFYGPAIGLPVDAYLAYIEKAATSKVYIPTEPGSVRVDAFVANLWVNDPVMICLRLYEGSTLIGSSCEGRGGSGTVPRGRHTLTASHSGGTLRAEVSLEGGKGVGGTLAQVETIAFFPL